MSELHSQAAAIADSYSERIPDRARLTRDEVALLLQLHKAGKTQVEIAQVLGIDQSNVSRWLSKLIDTSELAKHTLKNGANTLAERVIAKADVDQSLEVLDRLGVAEKRQERGAVNIFNAVQVGRPGEPIGPDPIDLSPVTFAPREPE